MHHNCHPHTRTRVSHVCVRVWKGGLFIATRVGQLNLPPLLPLLTLLAPTSLIVKCMQTVSEYSSHCCCYSRDWCCSGCRYFCASDGNTFINFTAGHWQRQQAPPVASCQSHSHYVWTFFLRAQGCLDFSFLFPIALLLLLLQT